MSISCNTPRLGVDKLDLEKVSTDFNIPNFYAGEIEKKEAYTALKRDGKRPTKNYGYHDIIIDSLYDDTSKNIVAIQYKMPSSSSADAVAYFNKKDFQKIAMLKSPNGDFMGLVAEKFNREDVKQETKEFEELVDYLTLKNGKPEIKEVGLIEKNLMYSWIKNDFLIAVKTKIDAINFGDKEESISNTRIFIINRKYLSVITEKIHEGDWLSLK